MNFLFKLFLLCFFAGIGVNCHAQELKKKIRGTYSGNMPAFYMEVGEKLLEGKEAQLTIEFLEGNNVKETIGSAVQEGLYRITNDSKTTVTLQVNYPNQMIYEVIEINKKDKTLVRKGFYPQPECKLTKTI